MARYLTGLLFLIALTRAVAAPPLPFETSDGQESADYPTGMAIVRSLAAESASLTLLDAGPTDSGLPLEVVLYAADGRFDATPLATRRRPVVLILNAIHPGEPDGVDATLLLLRDLAADPVYRRVMLAAVPYYNVGGALNRNGTTRANQNGPREYGFRGNARNFDLNRDFIKADSRNARSFARLVAKLDPDIFIDTHTTNGADYQHVMTLLATQRDKLGDELGRYSAEVFMPALYAASAEAGYPAVPYVHVYGRPPDSGYEAFYDLPRYSSGYLAQFQTLALLTESHMLKDYADRVAATGAVLRGALAFAESEGAALLDQRRRARKAVASGATLVVDYRPDPTRFREVAFSGYAATETPGAATGLPQIRYDRERPWQRTLPFYDRFVPATTVTRPRAYLIPRGYWPVIERLRDAGVPLTELSGPREFEVEVYRIDDFRTRESPYEGHYAHFDTRVSVEREYVTASAGDVLVTTGGRFDQFLVNVLEPVAPDSYFNWNFFDSILQRKEYFSSYLFEETAARMLREDPSLHAELERQKAADEAFAGNARAQLRFVYERSIHSEPAYQRYPVLRIVSGADRATESSPSARSEASVPAPQRAD